MAKFHYVTDREPQESLLGIRGGTRRLFVIPWELDTHTHRPVYCKIRCSVLEL